MAAGVGMLCAMGTQAAIQFNPSSSLITTRSSVTAGASDVHSARFNGTMPEALSHNTAAGLLGGRAEANTAFTSGWNGRVFDLTLEQRAMVHVSAFDDTFSMSAGGEAELYAHFYLPEDADVEITMSVVWAEGTTRGPTPRFLFYRSSGGNQIVDWDASEPSELQAAASLSAGNWGLYMFVRNGAGASHTNPVDIENRGSITARVRFIPAPSAALSPAPFGIIATRRRR